jgi:hypothetical protein
MSSPSITIQPPGGGSIIAQVYVYPYRRSEDGSRGFQEHHLGLSKLILTRIQDDNAAVPLRFNLQAIRSNDQEIVTEFDLSKDFRIRYATNEHFLMFLNKANSEIFGFGTAKDDKSVQRTTEFHKEINRSIVELQSQQLQLQRQLSRKQSSLQSTTSAITNKQNIDALTAFMPMSIVESAETVANEDNNDQINQRDTVGVENSIISNNHHEATGTTTSFISSPSLITTSSSSNIDQYQQQQQQQQHQSRDSTRGSSTTIIHPPTPSMALKTHLPIVQLSKTPLPTTSAEKADKILLSNLKQHEKPITQNPNSIPAELTFAEQPEPKPIGKQDYDSTVARLGSLDQFPTRSETSSNADHGSDPNVSKPYKVEHKTHISFGRDGFKGVPAAWIRELQRQFGVPLDQLPSSSVSGYNAKIPFVLQTLRDLLIDKGGLETVGIFRLAPQTQHSDQAKEDIDRGLLLSQSAKRDQDGKLIFDYEVHVISNLIKVWLRDLPTELVRHINLQKVEQCKTEIEAWEIVSLLPEPYLSVCQYLIDFLSVVASHHDINKMPPTNIAICFCPNLYKGNSADPMASLFFTQKLSKWFTLAIQYRIDHPREDMDNQVEELAMLYSTESSEMLPIGLVGLPTTHHSRKNSILAANATVIPLSILNNTNNNINNNNETKTSQ